MMVTVVKALVLLLLSSALILVLARGLAGHRRAVVIGAVTGMVLGGAVLAICSRLYGSDVFPALIRSAAGLWFLLLVAAGGGAAYQGAGAPADKKWAAWLTGRPFSAGLLSLAAGLTAGSITVGTVGGQTAVFVAIFVLPVAFVLFNLPGEWPFRCARQAGGDALPLAIVALLLAMAGLSPRLNIFTPLTMKVMKFIHDLIHQGFETLLVPDHPFFRTEVWNLIGLLFSREVGFWGGLVVWFAPALVIIWSIGRSRIPSVAHDRRGARRRKLLAGYLKERRARLMLPVLSVALLATPVYTNIFPTVEYWDPTPVPVTADPAGVIAIPRKGADPDLADGRLHKYLFRKGKTAARFFILKKPDGSFTADLDACSICQPGGYGQGEGEVICYYCRTLIPLDTVGKPGGCNPVPLPFKETGDALLIDAGVLLNSWDSTALTVGKGPGGKR